MLRIVIVGTSCSGKTTLADRIATIKDIPHIELDAINWGSNWTPLSIDEFRRRVQAEVAQDQWVLDGNYSKVRDLIWSRATHLLWAGNRETLKGVLFERDSILWWVIRTHRRRRREYRQLIESSQYSHLIVYEIRNSGDLQEVLLELGCIAAVQPASQKQTEA